MRQELGFVYRRLVLLLLVPALLLTIEPVTHASPDSARHLLAKGNKLFATGEYQEAFAVFAEGYATAPRPVFLRSMAFCKLKLYKHAEAQKLLQQYLDKYPKEKDQDRIAKTLVDLETVVKTKLTVQSRPQGADLFIDAVAAGKVGKTPYEGTIEPGTHTVILRAEGYAPTTRVFTIEAKQSIDLNIDMEIQLKISSAPVGATVHIDSPGAASAGVTPLETSIAPGTHTIYLKAAGYRTYQTTATAAENQPIEISAKLGIGLTVSSTPTGAMVSMDGTRVAGQTPVEIEATPGIHTIEIRRQGFKPVTKQVTVKPGQDASLNARLKGGLLSMRTAVPGAKVTVGNLEIGATPIENAPVPLGAQKVVVKHKQRRTWTRALDFNETQTVSGNLKLGLRSLPFWSMVALSGAALVGGAIAGGVALAERSAVNGKTVYDAGTAVGEGYCDGNSFATYDGASAEGLLTSANGAEKVGDVTSCSYAAHHVSTVLLSAGAASAIGAAIYYFFFMRPTEEIIVRPRGEAVAQSTKRP